MDHEGDQVSNESAPNRMAPHTLSPMQRQALAKLNVPARILVGEVGSYASAKAELRAWEQGTRVLPSNMVPNERIANSPKM